MPVRFSPPPPSLLLSSYIPMQEGGIVVVVVEQMALNHRPDQRTNTDDPPNARPNTPTHQDVVYYVRVSHTDGISDYMMGNRGLGFQRKWNKNSTVCTVLITRKKSRGIIAQ